MFAVFLINIVNIILGNLVFFYCVQIADIMLVLFLKMLKRVVIHHWEELVSAFQ